MYSIPSIFLHSSGYWCEMRWICNKIRHSTEVKWCFNLKYKQRLWLRWVIIYVGSRGGCVCGGTPHPLGRGNSVVGWEAGHKWFPLHPALWCPNAEGGEEGGGEVSWIGQGGIPVLPEEVKPPAVFPLGESHADVGRRNPALPDAAVGGPSRMIANLLFTYSQVSEYGSFHFFVRWMAMRLSVASALNPRRQSIDPTKGVKCQRSLRKALR